MTLHNFKFNWICEISELVIVARIVPVVGTYQCSSASAILGFQIWAAQNSNTLYEYVWLPYYYFSWMKHAFNKIYLCWIKTYYLIIIYIITKIKFQNSIDFKTKFLFNLVCSSFQETRMGFWINNYDYICYIYIFKIPFEFLETNYTLN